MGQIAEAQTKRGMGNLDELYRSADLWTICLLYTSDAADERSSVDLGGRRIIKKKNNECGATTGNNINKKNKCQ